MNKEDLNTLLITNFNLSNKQIEQLEVYYSLLVEKSKVMNLTTITELSEVYIKHFYDSLLVSKCIDLNRENTLADIGTGAGFPGLVLKIAYPNLKVYLIEPTKKRCLFLEEVKSSLGLKDIYIINDRAENYIKNNREKFDVVCARAVANLNILLELCTPYVKVEKNFIALKSISYQEELNNALIACKTLNIKNTKTYTYELPENMGSRTILFFEKKDITPIKYPRLYTKIKNKPL